MHLYTYIYESAALNHMYPLKGRSKGALPMPRRTPRLLSVAFVGLVVGGSCLTACFILQPIVPRTAVRSLRRLVQYSKTFRVLSRVSSRIVFYDSLGGLCLLVRLLLLLLWRLSVLLLLCSTKHTGRPWPRCSPQEPRARRRTPSPDTWTTSECITRG